MIQNKNLLGNRIVTEVTNLKWGNFPGGSDGKESACNEGDSGLIPGSGRSPRERNGNPLQYSFLGNPMDRGAWQAINPWGLKESMGSQSQIQLSD